MIRHRPPQPARRGLTLMEVVVSMAIFLMSVLAVYQIIQLGAERSLDVHQQTRASLLCQSKLAEVMAGVEPMSSTGGGYAGTPDDAAGDLSDWTWRMEASEAEVPELYDVKVWVRYERPTGRVVEAHLCQKVLAPASRGSTLQQPATTEPMSPDETAPATGGTTGGS